MICPNCHSQIQGNSRFCPTCGASVPQAAPQPGYPPQGGYGQPAYNQPGGYPNQKNTASRVMKFGAISLLSPRMLCLTAGICWIFPFLGCFIPTISITNKAMKTSASLLGLADTVSFGMSAMGGSASGSEASMLLSALNSFKTWVIILMLLFAALAAAGIFLGVKEDVDGKWKGLFAAVSIFAAAILLCVMNILNSIFSGVTSAMQMSSSAFGSGIGLTFFAWLMILAVLLSVLASFWNVWKLADGEE